MIQVRNWLIVIGSKVSLNFSLPWWRWAVHALSQPLNHMHATRLEVNYRSYTVRLFKDSATQTNTRSTSRLGKSQLLFTVQVTAKTQYNTETALPSMCLMPRHLHSSSGLHTVKYTHGNPTAHAPHLTNTLEFPPRLPEIHKLTILHRQNALELIFCVFLCVCSIDYNR